MSATLAPAAPVAAPARPGNKLTLIPLVALVVGSMVGGGVFNLPHDLSAAAAPGAIVLGWTITGIGMLALAFVYQGLAIRKPALNTGPYAYARAGFGDFIGFNSAWGYWISGWLGNVAYAVAIFGALSYFVPAFGAGNNIASIIGASVGLWLVHALVLRGVRDAAFVNVITTIAKLVPLLLFFLVAIVAFNWNKFTFDFWGAGNHAAGIDGLGSVLHQVKSTMLVTLWVFIGIEGASVYSARAASRRDIGRATVIGFVGVLGIYILASLLATGILSQKALAGLKVPAMAGVFEPLVGAWGAALINVALVVSVGGAFLAWTLLTAEIPFACGKDGIFPRWFARTNAAGSPVNSLWVTNGLIQVFLVVSLLSNSAYQFFYSIASVAILPPYLLSGAYALKLTITGETYQPGERGRGKDMAIGLLATVYAVWLLYAAGPAFMLMTAILFLPGIAVYALARREAGLPWFVKTDAIIAAVIVGLAGLAIWLIATGSISPF